MIGPEDDNDFMDSKDFSDEYTDGKTRLDEVSVTLENITGSI